MPSIKFFGNHEFVTHGIWVHKGRKKVFCNEKQTTEFLQSNLVSDAKINVFTSKRKVGGLFVSLYFNKDASENSGNMKIERIDDNNTFKINLIGDFVVNLSDVELKMIFYNDQKIEDLSFSIQGIEFGDLMSGGGVSRTDMWDAEIEDDIFPSIDFEYDE